MSSFDTALKAFQESQIDLETLLIAASTLASQSEQQLATARNLVDSEYQAGRLVASAYYALCSAFEPATQLEDATEIVDEDKTRHAPKANLAPANPKITDDDDDKTLQAVSVLEEEAVTVIDTGNRDSEVTVLDSASHEDEATLMATTQLDIPPKANTGTISTRLTTESLLQGLDPSLPYTELTVGSTLKNRFVLEDILGVGGMGMVFKASDLRKVEAADKDHFVALKVLNQEFQSNPMALVALQRETKRAQNLAHPNIIKVFDFDRDGAHVFMSMEYLQGRPLSHLIREHADSGMPFKKAWPIIRAMADALGYAHQKNIVHSDFKPGNVFISDDGEVRVLDFGIACAINRSEKDGRDVTVFNARDLGAMTPAYASLEQLQHREPDPRDDIYALGCISYELLTGKHPFGRLSAEKAMELNLSPKPIPQLKRRQWKMLQKSLAFKQDQRCASIAEFLGDLGIRSKLFYALWTTVILMTGLLSASVYWNVNAPKTLVEAPKIVVELTPEQQQKIQDLLELAEIHFDVGYLTAPTGSNAFWAYQEVLKIDPYNANAISGINKIADALEQQAWEFYEKNDRSEALKKVQDGLEVNSSHAGLLSLREKLRFH
ncbi:MAG: hypothetical protein RL563_1469 [Pseudomonadota bacterium]